MADPAGITALLVAVAVFAVEYQSFANRKYVANGARLIPAPELLTTNRRSRRPPAVFPVLCVNEASEIPS